MPEVQYDHQVRVVALANLNAMCKRQSGTGHQCHVVKITENRVYVEYSNPDEWARCDHPMTAVFPAYRDSRLGIMVVLDILRVEHDNWDGAGWQAFNWLQDCPILWRDPVDNTWYTREEIEAQKLK